MRSNTDMEIEKALHKVRLTVFLKCAGKRKGEAEGAQRGQISQLFFFQINGKIKETIGSL